MWWDVLAFQTTLNYLDATLALKMDCWRPCVHENASMIFPILGGIALPASPSGEIVATTSLWLFNPTLILTSVGEYRRLNVGTGTPIMLISTNTLHQRCLRPSHQTGCASITIQGDANGGIRFPRSGVGDPCHLLGWHPQQRVGNKIHWGSPELWNYVRPHPRPSGTFPQLYFTNLYRCIPI